jgi:hypothetical protein
MCSLLLPIAFVACHSDERAPAGASGASSSGAAGASAAHAGAPPAAGNGGAGGTTSVAGAGAGGAGAGGSSGVHSGGAAPIAGATFAGSGGEAGSEASTSGGVAGASAGAGGSSTSGGSAGVGGAGSTSTKLRVIVSSDIGGTDNDDQQSMAHFLAYSDLWDVEGLIASPWGDGRTDDILEAIDAYELDYPNLVTHSADYPSPSHLRSVTKQGAIDKAEAPGWGEPTEGSEWIAEVANRPDPRPVWITVWGALDDLAQALHDHPEIESKLRVYWIGGPNKRHSPESYPYVHDTFRELWFIEANTTYRGFFNGGDQSGDLSNDEFPAQHVRDHGALGDYFMFHREDIKMGDTPAVLYTIDNAVRNPNDPTLPGWGGAFVPADNGYATWWTDNPDPSVQVGDYPGAETVSVHREAFLRDFQARMDRCQSPR